VIVRPRVTIAWLTGEDATPAAVEDWCRWRAALDTRVTVLEQVAPGRGILSRGRAALLGSEVPAPVSDSGQAWWDDVPEAHFALRSRIPPDSTPRTADAPFLLMTRVRVADQRREGFREWLDAEHGHRQLSVPGSLWYLGYEELGERHSFLNLWGLLRPGVVESELWRRTSDTPWRSRMLSAIEATDRAVYRVVVP
jgi:hypothetical protein